MPVSQPPLCLALILADHVHRDFGSGKTTILGTFSNLVVQNFPAPHQFCVYCVLTDGREEPNVTICVVPADDDSEKLVEAGGPMKFSDPRAVMEIGLPMVVAFPGPGEYRVQAWADDHILMERRLIVLSAPVTPGGANAPNSDSP